MRHSTVAHAKGGGFGLPAPGCQACQEFADTRCGATYGSPGMGECVRDAGHTEVFHKDQVGNQWVGRSATERTT